MIDNNEIDLEKFQLRLEDKDVKKSLAPKFNVFDVLKIKSNEVLNSNVLAWLLNPKETHGLEDSFLKKFFKKIIIKNESLKSNLFDDVQVYTEFNFIDIMVISHSNRFILIIENKIYTDEHDDQLSKYYDYIKSLKFENYKVYPFFLTLDRHEPEKEEDKINWKAISHSEILEITESAIEQKEDIEDDVRYFLEDYMKTLGELTMQEDENKQLCDDLYAQYHKEIEYILKNSSKPVDYLQKELEKNEMFKQVSVKNYGNHDILRFVTDDMLKIWGERDNGKTNTWNTMQDFMVEIFCTPYPTKIKLTFQLVSMEESDKLKAKALLSKVISFKENDSYIVILQNNITGLPKNSMKEYMLSLNVYVNKIVEWICDEAGYQSKIDALMNKNISYQ